MHYTTKPSTSLRARLLGTSAVIALTASLNIVPARDADAAGFALKEQSAAALGNAFAGATAGAEDVTYMFFNPAGLTRHDGNQVSVVGSYIIVDGETNNAATTPNVGGEAFSGDAADDAFVPAAYLMWSLSPDLKLGLGINAPFGLTTEYSQTWQGRFHAVESSMTTVNLNPTIAYRVNSQLSLGVGLQAQYMDVTLSSIVDVDPGPGIIEALGEVTGDDWAFGVTLGALYEFSDTTRMGLGYRSQVSQTLEGDFTVGGAPVSGAEADFKSPDTISLGLYHDYNDQFAVMAETVWTRWSTFDELRIEDGSGGLISVTPEDWDDVWFFALGATWKPNEKWAFRGGVAYDQTPISDDRRTPRITDEDRTWLAIGAQFRPTPNVTIDAGYTHIFVKDGAVNLAAGYTTPGLPALTADYENNLDILTVQATFRF